MRVTPCLGVDITVRLENVVLDDQTSAALGDLQAGDYVMLSVSDTGVGMDEESLSQIFGPFYTAKEVEKGSNPGFSTVFGIVKQSSGGIEVESEPGKGTTFRIYLPKVEVPTPVEAKKRLSSPIEGIRKLLKRTPHGREALLISQGVKRG